MNLLFEEIQWINRLFTGERQRETPQAGLNFPNYLFPRYLKDIKFKFLLYSVAIKYLWH